MPEADDQTVPRWHAPPPLRDAMSPSPAPTGQPERPAATAAVAPARRWPARLAPPLLSALLLLLAALAGWPSVRAVVVRSQPATRQALMPQVATGVGCFATLTLVESSDTAVVGRDASEVKARDTYDLSFYPGRLGTLIDAHLLTLGYVTTPFVAPSIQATRAAAVRGRAAWLLSFSRTPPLEAPSAPAALPPDTTTDRGGATATLADGRPARFDDPTTMQVLTWHDGAAWYQILAARRKIVPPTPPGISC